MTVDDYLKLSEAERKALPVSTKKWILAQLKHKKPALSGRGGARQSRSNGRVVVSIEEWKACRNR